MTDTPTKRRGRPRAYDPEAAINQVTDVFWNNGYEGVSLDDLSAATGMNRPSLYNAFGDKRALFQMAMERYQQRARETMRERFLRGGTLREGLERIYDAALDFYLSGDLGQRGCFLINVGLTEAVADPTIRDTAASGLHELDRGFERLVQRAQAAGELAPGVDPLALAKVASGILNALAVRARAGEDRAQLQAMITATIDLICGPQASE
ncbi:MAG: TetR/AcrR family transcriptional regulator [Caulobacter sp.]|nr:TetR/AcrR family transcriptional regulator [Caulobacter sp.]